MNHINDITNILKLKIELKDYYSAIEILKKKIIEIYVLKINEIDEYFKYTNILNLMDKTQKTLNRKYNSELKKYFCIINDDCCQEHELYILMNIYSNIKE